ncbi:MAG: cytochrome b6f subunit PetP [Chroococcales cyanobacterium]
MKIGQKVKVTRLRERLSADTLAKIKTNPVGTIKDFKMTDGSGVGVVVQLDSGITTWFFEDEVQAL